MRLALLSLLTAAAMFAADGPKIKQVPMKQTSPVDGKAMFSMYCAVCHGAEAKGNGPAAPAMKRFPGDLTKLAVNNHGKFPDDRVAVTIAGANGIAAHGSNEMPIWGDLFKSVSSDQSIVRLRISNLTDYVKSIQTK
jgi:mono/diheme cytochrome c family protein